MLDDGCYTFHLQVISKSNLRLCRESHKAKLGVAVGIRAQVSMNRYQYILKDGIKMLENHHMPNV